MATSSQLLQKELKSLQRKLPGITVGLLSDNNIFVWQICFLGPAGTLFQGGVFNAIMSFPHEYPLLPPAIRFTTSIWHPNIYPDGRVCLSLLHAPGPDPFGNERPEERWNSEITIETVLLSVVNLLLEPNDMSPANVEAAKEWRSDRDTFNSKVKICVEKSIEL